MKSILALLTVAVLLVGCKPDAPTENPSDSAVSPDASSTASAGPKLDDIPAELKGDAYEYFGLGNSTPIDMEVTQTGGTSVRTGAQMTTLKSIENGEAVFSVARTGALADVGAQTITLKEEGVFLTASSGAKISGDGLELPNGLTAGKTWKNHVILEKDDGTKFDLTTNSTCKGVTKFKTKVGDREGILVEASGSGTMNGTPVTVQGQSWYVKGVGGVKSSFTYTTKDGTKQTISIEEIK